MFINGKVASPEDPVGMFGDTAWIVKTKPSNEEYYKDETPLIDLTELRAPTTPSDGSPSPKRRRRGDGLDRP